MDTKLNPYISFDGNARQAMEFYKTVFGGELKMSTFKEYNLAQNPGDSEKIMHSVLEIGPDFTIMGADTPTGMEYDNGKRITLSLSGENDGELRGYFQKLSSGGTVGMPLEKAPWGDSFGMVTDRFGVDWMVNISAPNAMRQGEASHTEQHTTR